ncbi:MAG TPA: dihydrodipicolinate synthase family protein [Stellaceae bacterium]|nr:dihydrodipicolinate synthase family protein [Stellaceae bacterium]
MQPASSLRGVWPAVLTPFDKLLAIDDARLARHCKALLAAGCRGVSLFGTTGEGTALSADERQRSLEAVIAAGVPAARIMPSTGCCDVPTSAALAAHAAGLGVECVLVLPPFYLKDVNETGIYAHIAATIERTAALARGRSPKICLYNFPFHTGITLAPALVRRLAVAFPGIVVSVKDSSGDWPLSSSYLRELPDLDIFVGDERTILSALRAGGAGTVSGMANAIAPDLVRLCAGEARDAEPLQHTVSAAVAAVTAHSFVPAVKAALAELWHEGAWRAVRPPLEAASPGVGASVLAALRTAGANLLKN